MNKWKIEWMNELKVIKRRVVSVEKEKRKKENLWNEELLTLYKKTRRAKTERKTKEKMLKKERKMLMLKKK